jgi:hypothetical protein
LGIWLQASFPPAMGCQAGGDAVGQAALDGLTKLAWRHFILAQRLLDEACVAAKPTAVAGQKLTDRSKHAVA